MRTPAFIVCLLLGAGLAQADPVWVPPKNTFHLAVSFTQAFWDQFLQTGSDSVNLPGEIDQYELALHGEYVPMENLSVDISFPIVVSRRKFSFLETDLSGNILGVQLGGQGQIRDVNNNTGIGDIRIGMKYIFWDQGVSVGVRPFVKFPGSYAYGDIVNAPGDGQTDIGISLLTGAYFRQIRSYLRGSFTLVQRFGEPDNQLEVMIEPGVYVFRTLAARFVYHYIEQFGGEDILFFGLPNYYPAVEEDAHRIGFGLSYKATDLFGAFAIYQQTIAGKNTANTKVFTLGVEFSF